MAPVTLVTPTPTRAFVKDNSAEITLAYYCVTFALASAAFIYGTIYLPRRNREDEQRKEWRKFAKSVFGENSNLRAQDVPQRISKVKDTFKEIQMSSLITGLDVLRYMLAEGNYESFKTNELECLHDNLQSIFHLFWDIHSSLSLLGKVPGSVKEKLKDAVTELGMMAEPFFERGKRQIILECLEHFSIDKPKIRLEELTERPSPEELEEALPYIKSCRFFGAPEANGFHYGRTIMELENRPDYGTRTRMELKNTPDYSKCTNFSLYIKDDNTHGIPLHSLQDLHKGLVDPRCLEQIAMKLRELAPTLNLIDKINDNDRDKRVIEKVLHEVRVYIHNGSQNDANIEENMKILLKLWKDLKRTRSSEDLVRLICDRLIVDLQTFQAYQLHCNGEEFCKGLQERLETYLQRIQSIKCNDSTSRASTPQIPNPQQLQFVSNV